jgi:hypothetical protein
MSQNEITVPAPELSELLAAGFFSLDAATARVTLVELAEADELEDEVAGISTGDVAGVIDRLKTDDAIRAPHGRWEIQIVRLDTHDGEDEAILTAVENWSNGSRTAAAPFLRLTGLPESMSDLLPDDGRDMDVDNWLELANGVVDDANRVLAAAAVLVAPTPVF